MMHSTNLRLCGALSSVLLMLSCDGQNGGGSETGAQTNLESGHMQTSQEAVEIPLPSELAVSPELIESGRVTLVAARTVTHDSGRRIPGEVVSSPEGAAEVSALVGGRIAASSADIGDRVKKGQVLAWVESPEVGVARAELARAAAQLEREQSRFARQESLQKEGATSPAAVDTARAALRAAQAEHSSAGLRLSALGANAGSGAKYGLSSPIDGVVTARNAVLGASVHPETLLFSIIAPGHIRVIAHFPEGGSELPAAGTKVQLARRGETGNQTCDAIVETNANVVDPHTRTVLVRLRPSDDCNGLRPGAYVEVLPHSDESAATATGIQPATTSEPAAGGTPGEVQIPATSVVFVRGKETVFVAGDKPGQFFARHVQVSSLGNGRALITQGVESGDRVVEKGTILLKGEMMREVLGGE